MSLEKLETWLQKVYDRRITQEYDALVPVVADEGNGKSTLMLQLTWMWKEIRGQKATPENVLERVIWGGREEFANALANDEPESCVPVMDAARVLNKKETMVGEQREIEKDLLDVRMKSFLMLLGFQSWDRVASMLQDRRAKFVLRVPRRGVVEGYSRASIDKRVESESWPEPDMQARFPSLEGTRLWEEFKERDLEAKERRIRNSGDGTEDADDEGPTPQSVVAEIKRAGVGGYVSQNEFNESLYIDKKLIKFDYPELSDDEADQVKAALRRDDDIVLEEVYQPTDEGGPPQTPQEG